MRSKTRTLIVVGVLSVVMGSWLFDQIFTSIFTYFRVPNQSVVGDSITLATFLGFLVAAVLSFILLRVGGSGRFTGEVIDEVDKVAWPTAAETRWGTVVTIVFNCIVAGILFFFDAVFGYLTNNNYFLY